ncbi:MAG: PHP domain-containing protein [Spirochaetales bacterium]|nr:PHP domain-containing protein [Spirochaetales bacterium]
MEAIETPGQTYNLHTHTFRCKHAEGDVADYAAEAVAAGARMLGFSEHPPLIPEDIWTAFRIDEGALDDYFDAISSAKQDFPELKILTGFEMDLYPRFKSYYEDTFLHRSEIDYLAGGVHWIKYRGEWMWIQEARTAGHLREYFRELLGLMESGLCSFLTHPDSFALGYLSWDENAEALSRDILSAAEEFRIPLEINGYGLRRPEIKTPDGPRKGYPLLNFWKLAAEYDISVVCNSDAHRPQDVMAALDECREIADRFGLKHHPIEQELSDTVSDNTGSSR